MLIRNLVTDQSKAVVCHGFTCAILSLRYLVALSPTELALQVPNSLVSHPFSSLYSPWGIVTLKDTLGLYKSLFAFWYERILLYADADSQTT